MAKNHTINDLLSNSKIHLNKLTTDVLQEFYLNNLVNNAYIFDLSNNEQINLIFTEEQFCHLIGFHYFNYDGIVGWEKLIKNPKNVISFISHKEFNLIKYRIANFHKLLLLLSAPDVYIYKSEDYPQYRYKSKYFAVFKENNRVFKLGIGISNNNIHYGETYIIDMDIDSYNQYLKPESKLSIINKSVVEKTLFLHNLKEKKNQKK